MVDEMQTSEPMLHSQEIGELAADLSKAQAGFPPIKKTHTADVRSKHGASYKYNYADLADVLEMVRPSLAKYELAILQPITKVAGEGRIITLLIHSSGQWIRSEYSLRLAADVTDTPQAWGSAITYARRYSLCSLLGVAAEEDDDGTGDTTRTPRNATKGEPPKANGTPANKPPDVAATVKAINLATTFDELRATGQRAQDQFKDGALTCVKNAIYAQAVIVFDKRLGAATTPLGLDELAAEVAVEGEYHALFPTDEVQTMATEQIQNAKAAMQTAQA